MYNFSNAQPSPQKRSELLPPTPVKRQFAQESGVPSIDFTFLLSGTLPFTKHLLLISDIGPWMYFDCFTITSTDSASLTGTQGTITGVYPWNPAATAGARPATSSSSSTSQLSSSSSASQQSDSPANSQVNHNEGPIIGGVVGGVAIVLIAIMAFLWLLRRRRYARDHFGNLLSLRDMSTSDFDDRCRCQ